MISTPFLFVDIHARPYFQEMSARFKYKKDGDSTLMLAPVQSWASGEFRVNLVSFQPENRFDVAGNGDAPVLPCEYGTPSGLRILCLRCIREKH